MIRPLLDLEPEIEDFREEALIGLTAVRKTVSPKFLYDQRGSELFDEICRVAEYYPTRTEMDILEAFGPEIAEEVGENTDLIEFGSGASKKLRLLLKHLRSPALYVPIDISGEFLMESCEKLARECPRLPILPVCADYTRSLDKLVASLAAGGNRALFFPGSTIGNFERQDAEVFLRRSAELVGRGGKMIVGFDLIKPVDVLEAAYNDSAGVTAAFNLNLLTRMNRELGADFRLDRFEHLAYYDREAERIEMHLVSRERQRVRVAGTSIAFGQGETIHTESSHKFTVESFTTIARAAGFEPRRFWIDEAELFAVGVLESKGILSDEGYAKPGIGVAA